MRFPPLKSPLKFYAVVPTAEWVERMVRAGADTVQLRCKTLHGDELKREIERCVAACRGSRTQLFINDHWREGWRRVHTACIWGRRTWIPPISPPSQRRVCGWG